MRQDQAEEAARLLCAARRGGEPIAELPTACRPQSDIDAYQIQDAAARQLGEAIGGWKVGAASPTTAAFCAPIYARMIRPSPASYNAAELRLIAIEAELAFRLGLDLPQRAQPYDRADVTAGATLHPVIEVVNSRFVDPRVLARPLMLADNYANGGLVWSAAVSRASRLTAQPEQLPTCTECTGQTDHRACLGGATQRLELRRTLAGGVGRASAAVSRAARGFSEPWARCNPCSTSYRSGHPARLGSQTGSEPDSGRSSPYGRVPTRAAPARSRHFAWANARRQA